MQKNGGNENGRNEDGTKKRAEKWFRDCSLGFIIMMFLVDVFDCSDKTKTTKNKSVQTTKETKDKEADKPTLQTKRKICLQEYLQRALHLMEQRLETFFVCNYSADGKYIIEVGSMFGDTQEVFIDIKK